MPQCNDDFRSLLSVILSRLRCILFRRLLFMTHAFLFVFERLAFIAGPKSIVLAIGCFIRLVSKQLISWLEIKITVSVRPLFLMYYLYV